MGHPARHTNVIPSGDLQGPATSGSRDFNKDIEAAKLLQPESPNRGNASNKVSDLETLIKERKENLELYRDVINVETQIKLKNVE